MLVVAPCGNDMVPSPGSCYSLQYAMHMFNRHRQVRIDRCDVIPDVDVMGSFVFRCIFEPLLNNL